MGILAATWWCAATTAAGNAPRISVLPPTVYVEHTAGGESVSCDFVVENPTAASWTLQAVEVSALDARSQLAVRRFVNDNGNSPSVATLNHREVAPGGRVLLFNPLYRFDPGTPLDTLVYRFAWQDAEGHVASATTTVKPVEYRPRVPLRLPLRGRILVWDGHDYYAHHRRFDYASGRPPDAPLKTNPDRYSYDLVPVDLEGRMATGPEAANASWLGFGRAVYAAGAGRVVAVVDDEPDERRVNEDRFAKNELADYGNYVLVEQGPGEIALYGHVRQGSARVRAGDRVRQGQEIAAIGASGSSLMPHLHFHLQTTADDSGEGLPSRFTALRLWRGSRGVVLPRAAIDSGDIVEDAPAAARPPPGR